MSHKLDRNSFGDPANAGNLMSIEEATYIIK